jgi:hypothetical protein
MGCTERHGGGDGRPRAAEIADDAERDPAKGDAQYHHGMPISSMTWHRRNSIELSASCASLSLISLITIKPTFLLGK